MAFFLVLNSRKAWSAPNSTCRRVCPRTSKHWASGTRQGAQMRCGTTQYHAEIWKLGGNEDLQERQREA